MLPAIAFAYE
jgi:sodium/potassium-transporting ATPase subunit alpha